MNNLSRIGKDQLFSAGWSIRTFNPSRGRDKGGRSSVKVAPNPRAERRSTDGQELKGTLGDAEVGDELAGPHVITWKLNIAGNSLVGTR